MPQTGVLGPQRAGSLEEGQIKFETEPAAAAAPTTAAITRYKEVCDPLINLLGVTIKSNAGECDRVWFLTGTC